MFEGYAETSRRLEDGIKLGRIAYILISLIPYLPLLSFLHYPISQVNALSFFFYIFLLLLTSLPLTVIGGFSIVRSFHFGHSQLFWPIATVIAMLPLYFALAAMVYSLFQPDFIGSTPRGFF